MTAVLVLDLKSGAVLELWPGTPILPKPSFFERRITMSY